MVTQVQTFNICSDTSELKNVREHLTQMLVSVPLDNKERYSIVMAVDEAVMNIIEHGHNNCADVPISITFEINDKKIMCSLISKSPLLEYSDSARLDLEKHRQEYKTHGLGKFLMKRFMDEIYTRRIDDTKTELNLVKYI